MVASFQKVRSASRLVPAATVCLLAVVFMVDARSGASQKGTPASLGVLETTATVASRPADPQSPPIDAAMKAATVWLTLLDSGECSQAWSQSHSVVRGLISREAWTGLCKELFRSATDKYGAFVSLRIVQVEFVNSLPMGLGDGVSVHFRSTYQTGEYPGPKILVAKDKDGVWRMVRSDKE